MEGNRTVDVLIPTYKPDQRCVQLVKRLLNQSVQVNRIYLIDTESGIFPKELYTISDRVKIGFCRKSLITVVREIWELRCQMRRFLST